MSHFVAKSIVVKPNGEIFCIGDDNNVYPKFNMKVKFQGNFNELCKDILNGVIQPVSSSNNYKWSYAIYKSSENNTENTTFEERVEKFKKSLKIKHNGKYILHVKNITLCDINKNVYSKQKGHCLVYSFKEDATKYSFYQAHFLSKRYGLEMERV